MRPRAIGEILGQEHLLGASAALPRALAAGHLYSMLLWGPPGSGKTTLARLLSAHIHAEFHALSAVLAGVAELRQAVALAKRNRENGLRTVLFVDEIHRFNKAQQDALLPHVEDGTLIFIGASTENPSFAVNHALLSRARVHVLKPLTNETLVILMTRALSDPERGLGELGLRASDATLQMIAEASDGDARRALTTLEIAAELSEGELTEAQAASVLGNRYRRFDKHGDQHHELISALHKTIRNSHPDAALYWFCRMLDGGVDPEYLARRLLRVASEDIGNADPRALTLALNAWQSYERLGSPEGELALAQLVLYLAVAPKSNAAYVAYNQARALVSKGQSAEVPVHLRNAPTKLMKALGYGHAYQYDHDFPDAIALSQTGFPEGMEALEFYHPVARGLEVRIQEKLAWVRKGRTASRNK